MNVINEMKKLRSVRRISNSQNLDQSSKISFLFFVCPRMKAPGIIMEHGMLTCTYVPGLSGFAEARIAKVRTFFSQARSADIDCDVTAIFADADSFILFENPVSPPPGSPRIPDIKVQSNFHDYLKLIEIHSEFCKYAPWKDTPARITEEQRLKRLLPENTPRELKEDFVRRTFAGFALDGVAVRRGMPLGNPVLLGVESPGVVVLQNVALQSSVKLPVVELD